MDNKAEFSLTLSRFGSSEIFSGIQQQHLQMVSTRRGKSSNVGLAMVRDSLSGFAHDKSSHQLLGRLHQ